MTHSLIAQLNAYSRAKVPFVALIGYDDECHLACPLSEARANGLSFKLSSDKSTVQSTDAVQLDPLYPPFWLYEQAFWRAREYFKSGDAYLLNLCFKTRLGLKLGLDEIYVRSNAPLVLKFKDEFVCFSPESFISITGDKISTTPMKGTIDASLPDAAQTLLADKKEFSEQAMMVDLMRNDLSIVANDVHVERFRFVQSVRTNHGELLQTSSEISGTLKPHYAQNYGDLFAALLPAGSITGTPKPRVREIIAELESERRGYFSGVFVLYDGECLRSWVLIRFIGKDAQGLYFHSGGGLTFESGLNAEYDELCKKVYLAF
ncbi:aminodeoxychorismate synthase component I [Campylobacter sp. 19-13652]|uniref:aminodeoxychorismate synthase component I n=1 Tax=Campylobacter sp. 19-13652 TaxID=2840180 RepID=UPI001C78BEDE|nr:aminodeoxychorismate synthase component I [Campylobacter sp. 19-13652]BCX78621.1 putative PabA-like protein [Campylobacter sp. 19-13652]